MDFEIQLVKRRRRQKKKTAENATNEEIWAIVNLWLKKLFRSLIAILRTQ